MTNNGNFLAPPAQWRLKELLHYDPKTGIFTWKQYRGHLAQEGFVAGRPDGSGHIQISVDGRRYHAHRLAWLYVYGTFPKACIDHINRIRDDNRISNLREATYAENGQNRCASRRNKSGKSDVMWSRHHNKWRARITINGNRIHLGYFESFEDAASARTEAKKKYHTFHPVDEER